MPKADWQDDESQRLCQELARRQRIPAGPRPIAEVVSHLLARRGYAYLQTAQQWEDLWSKAAGREVAAHCRTGKLRRGVLEIIVRNSSVLQELTFQMTELLLRVQQSAPDAEIKKLRFRVGEVD